MNKYLGHWLTEIIDHFDLLWGDVFTLRHLENILLPVSDLQRAILQQRPHHDFIHLPTTALNLSKEPLSQLCLQEAISQCLQCAATHPCRVLRLFSLDRSGILWIHLVLWRTPTKRFFFFFTIVLAFYCRSIQQASGAHLSLPVSCKVVHFWHVHQFHVIAG